MHCRLLYQAVNERNSRILKVMCERATTWYMVNVLLSPDDFSKTLLIFARQTKLVRRATLCWHLTAEVISLSLGPPETMMARLFSCVSRSPFAVMAVEHAIVVADGDKADE